MAQEKSRVLEIPGVNQIIQRSLYEGIFRQGFSVGVIAASESKIEESKIDALMEKYGKQFLTGLGLYSESADILDQVSKEGEAGK